MTFRWCIEAEEEYDAAIARDGGSFLKGEIAHVRKGIESGARDLTDTHKIIRPTPVHGELPWTILYTGGDGTYVGLLLVQASGGQLPESAYEIAQIRLQTYTKKKD